MTSWGFLLGSLTYSAIGTANIMGAAYKKLDVAKLDPGILMSDSDGPKPTADQAKTEAATPLAQQLRASLLQTMGLLETDVQNMRSDTRADFESHIAQRIHGQALATPNAGPGALVNIQA